MTGDKVTKQLERDAVAYKAGFADGYRVAKAEVNAIPVEWITKYVNKSGTSSIEQDIIREMVLEWIAEREEE